MDKRTKQLLDKSKEIGQLPKDKQEQAMQDYAASMPDITAEELETLLSDLEKEIDLLDDNN